MGEWKGLGSNSLKTAALSLDMNEAGIRDRGSAVADLSASTQRRGYIWKMFY